MELYGELYREIIFSFAKRGRRKLRREENKGRRCRQNASYASVVLPSKWRVMHIHREVKHIHNRLCRFIVILSCRILWIMGNENGILLNVNVRHCGMFICLLMLWGIMTLLYTPWNDVQWSEVNGWQGCTVKTTVFKKPTQLNYITTIGFYICWEQ